MKVLTILALFLSIIASGVSSYVFISQEKIVNDLGNFRFSGLEPKIILKVLKKEMIKPDFEYESPEYNFNGVLRLKEEFPVKHFGVAVYYVLKFSEDLKDEGVFFATFVGASAAFEAENTLFDFPEFFTEKEFEIEVKKVNWWPIHNIDIEIEK